VIGNTYFVRVYNSSTNILSTDFTICIESFPVSANDDCANAIAITPSVAPNCNFVSGTFSAAVLGTIPCETGSHQDVWYQFVATSEMQRVTLSAANALNHGFELIEGSCTGNSIACVNVNGISQSETYISDQFVIGNTYFIRVYNAQTTVSTGNFDVCVQSYPAPVNDNCANATAIIANQSCVYTPASFFGSTQSSTICETGSHQDLWYSFVAINDTMYVGLEASNDLNHGFEVLDACGGTSLNCTNANGVSASELAEVVNLTVGNTYHVRVYNANTNFSEQSFGVCVYGDDSNIGLTEEDPFLELTIYPNPSDLGIFYLTNTENIQQIDVYDVALKQVMHKETNLGIIDLSTYNSGVYFIRCTSNEGREIIRKVIKR
jgi:hypothetical protein